MTTGIIERRSRVRDTRTGLTGSVELREALFVYVWYDGDTTVTETAIAALELIDPPATGVLMPRDQVRGRGRQGERFGIVQRYHVLAVDVRYDDGGERATIEDPKDVELFGQPAPLDLGDVDRARQLARFRELLQSDIVAAANRIRDVRKDLDILVGDDLYDIELAEGTPGDDIRRHLEDGARSLRAALAIAKLANR